MSTPYKLLLALALLLNISPLPAKLSGSLTKEAIEQRLQSSARVHIKGTTATEQTPAGLEQVKSPKQIYNENCKMCHQPGLAGAPRLGNKADWAPKLTKGKDALLTNAWNGFKAMPPKGNCLSCSKDDLAEVIDYMLEKLQ